MPEDLCDKCGKPVKAGDARYTGMEIRGVYRHAACHDWGGKKKPLNELLDEWKSVTEKLKRAVGKL